jgi:hypothetical protein
VTRLSQADLRYIVGQQVLDVHELVDLLELSIEDILAKHPKALRDNAFKFGVGTRDDSGEIEDPE